MTSIHEIIVVLLIFCGGIAASSMIIAGMNSSYGITADTSFNATYNKMDTITNLTTSAQTSFENSGLSTLGVVYIITGAWNIILMMFSSLGIISSILADLSQAFGLPAWFGAMIMAIVVISLITAIIGAMLFRRDAI